MDTLFDCRGPAAFDRDALHDRLESLADRGVFIGGSSWKYEGWLDQIYTRERYQTRGKFSKKRFEETCLSEYASVFPTVCGDFSFYQFPSDAHWAKVFEQTPGRFRWGFKVPEQITVASWPLHPRYGALAGLKNPTFLDAGLLEQAFLRPLGPYRKNIGPLIFEFGHFGASDFASAAAFAKALDPFLAALPVGWRYAVEIRNAGFLQPEYFECLRAHNVPHVYNGWTRMPEIGEQMAIPGSATGEIVVARALLRKDRPYEVAVRSFAPYDRVQDPNDAARDSLRDLMEHAMVDGKPAFLFVNNRLEGNSPGTILAITD